MSTTSRSTSLVMSIVLIGLLGLSLKSSTRVEGLILGEGSILDAVLLFSDKLLERRLEAYRDAIYDPNNPIAIK